MNGCSGYFLFIFWGMGLFCTGAGFRTSSDGGVFLTVGIVCLLAAVTWTGYAIAAPRIAERKRKERLLYEQCETERKQRELAHKEGLEKYRCMDVGHVEAYRRGVKAMWALGVMGHPYIRKRIGCLWEELLTESSGRLWVS